MKRIMIDKDNCYGCKNCTIACMSAHNPAGDTIYDLDLEDMSNESRNYIELDQKGHPTPLFCRHCSEAECVIACMSGAMKQDEETKLITYDRDSCGSCFMCVMSCPFGILKPDRVNQKFVIKCDFCEDKDSPSCVQNCPTKAIHIEEVPEP
jgi:anaerobic carbon-monoxide dehydrogenase iron sulfur subunit